MQWSLNWLKAFGCEAAAMCFGTAICNGTSLALFTANEVYWLPNEGKKCVPFIGHPLSVSDKLKECRVLCGRQLHPVNGIRGRSFILAFIVIGLLIDLGAADV